MPTATLLVESYCFAADLSAKLAKLKALSDADKQLITTLQAKVEEQKKELDNRTVAIFTGSPVIIAKSCRML